MADATFRIYFLFSIIFNLIIAITGNDNAISDISSLDIESKITSNQFVLALFYGDNCKQCKTVRDDLSKVAGNSMILDLVIVAVNDDKKALEYNIKTFPAIIFFRRGVPILYDVDLIESNDVEIWMEHNRERAVKLLTDESFEHDTQISTGATTGDWFVLFQTYRCPQLGATWDAVAARLRHHLVVATVDLEANPKLQTRFAIMNCPSIIFFRHGHMYKYDLQKYDVSSLVSFAQSWYQNMKAVKVPPEPSPFDILTDSIAFYLKERIKGPYGTYIVGGSFIAVLTCFILLLVCTGTTKQEKLD